MKTNARQNTVNEPVDFQVDELFFSTTDLRGIILSGNKVFQRISQYNREQLLGSPHNIIRHPDMPRVVFKLLWDTIQAGKPISAYVKNKAKDGRYYWVVANVYPLGEDKFLSVRFKPTTSVFTTVEGLYTAMLEAEEKGGMDASAKLLFDTLASLGISSYDEFMQNMILAELKNRDQEVVKLMGGKRHDVDAGEVLRGNKGVNDPISRIANLCVSTQREYELLFEKIDSFREMAQKIIHQSSFLQGVAREIRVHSINTSVSSSRLGEKGRMLAAVSNALQLTSLESSRGITNASGHVDLALKQLGEATYTTCSAKLLFEMLNFFAHEMISQQYSKDSSENLQMSEVKENMLYLDTLLEEYSRKAYDNLQKLNTTLKIHSRHINEIEKFTRMLSIVKTTGTIEISWLDEAGEFSSVFAMLEQLSSKAMEEISQFRKLSNKIMRDLKSIGDINSTIAEAQSLIADQMHLI